VQNTGCGNGSERAPGGSDGNNSGTAAAAAKAIALERTSADFRSLTRRTTPYLRVAARLSSCAGVTCKTLTARHRDGSSVTESSWSISTDIVKADGGRIKQSFAEISLLRSDDTDARKATVRRFGRSDRSAQLVVIYRPRTAPAARSILTGGRDNRQKLRAPGGASCEAKLIGRS